MDFDESNHVTQTNWYIKNEHRGHPMKTFAALIPILLTLSAAHAATPCRNLADQVSKEFDAERAMSSGQPKCMALNLLISHLTDLASQCAVDEKFRSDVYLPLAKAIAAEAPKACHR
jgi:hypothetical protein